MNYLDRYALQRIVHQAGQALANAGIASPYNDARLLAEFLLGRSLLLVDTVDADFLEKFAHCVRRRCAHEPLQLITGQMWFRGLQLQARPGVFIVRPETEIVAGKAIEIANKMHSQGVGRPLVIDLCTGSGAIAAAVAAEVPAARVLAVDLDETALQSASANLTHLVPGRVELLHADVNAPSALAHLAASADVVVSNPPYLPDEECEDAETARYDPPLALFGGGKSGLHLPQVIVNCAAKLLRAGGALVMEHDPRQAAILRQQAQALGMQAETGQDLTGRDRFLVAKR